MTLLINVRTTPNVKHTSIMRPTMWGNPVILGKRCPECTHVHSRAEGVQGLLCYGARLLRRLAGDRLFVLGLHALEGVGALGCVCVQEQGEWHCHGDLLLAYLDAYSERMALQCGAATPAIIDRPVGLVDVDGCEIMAVEMVNPRHVAHRSGVRAVRGHLEYLRDLVPPRLSGL